MYEAKDHHDLSLGVARHFLLGIFTVLPIKAVR